MYLVAENEAGVVAAEGVAVTKAVPLVLKPFVDFTGPENVVVAMIIPLRVVAHSPVSLYCVC